MSTKSPSDSSGDSAQGASASLGQSAVSGDYQLPEGPTDAELAQMPEWSYERDGQVFGPVTARQLLEMLYRGEVNAETPIAADDEFRPLGEWPGYDKHVPRALAAQAQAKEDAERHAAETRRKRKKRIALLVLAILATAVGGYAVVTGVRKYRHERAVAAKQQEELRLRAEIESLLSTVTIEPPLEHVVLLSELKEKARAKRDKKRARTRKARAAQAARADVLGRNEVMKGVAKVLGGFKRCIVKQIKQDAESMPPKITLTFTIGNNGRSRNFQMKKRRLRDTPMEACLGRALAKARWRKFKGEIRNVEYPLTWRR